MPLFPHMAPFRAVIAEVTCMLEVMALGQDIRRPVNHQLQRRKFLVLDLTKYKVPLTI